jgi:hypothetical protein
MGRVHGNIEKDPVENAWCHAMEQGRMKSKSCHAGISERK